MPTFCVIDEIGSLSANHWLLVARGLLLAALLLSRSLLASVAKPASQRPSLCCSAAYTRRLRHATRSNYSSGLVRLPWHKMASMQPHALDQLGPVVGAGSGQPRRGPAPVQGRQQVRPEVGEEATEVVIEAASGARRRRGRRRRPAVPPRGVVGGDGRRPGQTRAELRRREGVGYAERRSGRSRTANILTTAGFCSTRSGRGAYPTAEVPIDEPRPLNSREKVRGPAGVVALGDGDIFAIAASSGQTACAASRRPFSATRGSASPCFERRYF